MRKTCKRWIACLLMLMVFATNMSTASAEDTGQKMYSVSVEETEHAKVTLNGSKTKKIKVFPGKAVEIKVVTDNGYQIDSVKATNSEGNNADLETKEDIWSVTVDSDLKVKVNVSQTESKEESSKEQEEQGQKEESTEENKETKQSVKGKEADTDRQSSETEQENKFEAVREENQRIKEILGKIGIGYADNESMIAPYAAGYDGERIYTGSLENNIGSIDIIDYHEDGSWDVIESWQEGKLGDVNANEPLYCADPNVVFTSGYKTGIDAEKLYTRETIQTVAAMFYYLDHHMCTHIKDNYKYMFKQCAVWWTLNEVNGWFTDNVAYETGNGETCGCGAETAGHLTEYRINGLEWAKNNYQSFRNAKGTIYQGDGQPVSKWTGDYTPEGSCKILKRSANPELTDGNSCYSLKGAAYGIYRNPNCSDASWVATMTTNENGESNTVTLNAGTYYVREGEAPKGYALDKTVYTVEVKAGETTNIEVVDYPTTDPVKILLGKIDKETNQNKPSGSKSLKDAEFTVKYYDVQSDSDPAIKGIQPTRTWVMRTDEEGRTRLAEKYKISGDEFYYSTAGDIILPLGTMTIQETKAPEGYLVNPEIFVRQIKDDGTHAEKVETYNAPTIPETPQKIRIELTKQDSETGGEQQGEASLKGALYEVFDINNTVVDTLTTDENGKAASRELPVADYTVKEKKAPVGYLLDPNTYKVEASIPEDTTTRVFTYRVLSGESVIRGGVQIGKWDSETNKQEAQGAATLKGTKIQLVNENVGEVMVDGKNYKKGEVVATLVTDEKGIAKTSNNLLPHGKYSYTETAAPEGYNNTGNQLTGTFTIEENGKIVDLNTSEKALKNDVIRGDVEIIKIRENEDKDKDTLEGLEGVEFTFTSKTTGKTVTKITTDKEGKATTAVKGKRGALPYDTYVVAETKCPEGLKPIEPFEVTIKEEGVTLKGIYKEDKLIVSPVSVVKKDKSTGETIPVKNTEFRILDANKNAITMTTHYPDKVVHETFKTDEKGQFTLPDKLKHGTYYLEELHAPEGYLKGELLEFRVEKGATWENPLIVEYFDDHAMGKIHIRKTDEENGKALEGAEFAIIAAEDVTTADGTVRAVKGSEVDRIVTDENGEAESRAVYLGKYKVEETKQPDGYIRSEKSWDVELKYKDQDTAVVVENLEVTNKPTEIVIDKKVTGSEERLRGVTFVVGPEKDKLEVYPDPAENKCEVYETDENGRIQLKRLPAGTYYMKELEGVTGYAWDTERIYEITIDQDGRVDGKDIGTVTVENDRTEITGTSVIDVKTDMQTVYPKQIEATDTVSIVNLQKGKEYTLKSELRDADTGEVLKENNDPDGELLQKEKTFEATGDKMEVGMDVSFDATKFAGRTIVVFERLYQDSTEISTHTDLKDKKQQLVIKNPKLQTTATEVISKTHYIYAKDCQKFTDKVTFKDLIPGTYTAKGIVMDKETEEPLLVNGKQVTVEKKVEIKEGQGSFDMEFALNASELAGKKIVVFEYMYQNGEEITEHTDLEDKDQQIEVKKPKLQTTATESTGGSHEAVAKKDITINDVVEQEGFIPGTYTAKGIVMDKETKEPVLINGKQVTAEKQVELKEDGSFTMEFQFDASELGGHAVVIYEYLYREKELVASHEDINDEGQTVRLKAGSLTLGMPNKNGKSQGAKTGDHTDLYILTGLMVASMVTACTVQRRRKKKEEVEHEE